ncbi:hypothetical protein OUZ56_025504 [Daphnia magna]|uniref:Uncharacterized protein n=1 Tax=Daphnia magna TaxID=35525 RepID=A0ABQ9ZL16_9CRUS|nr:hypothetical protein OUZ56_025504 [Daphnia magna]
MVKDESRAGKKIPLLKRWGRSFRQSFPSFRTGPGPNKAAANQKYIDEQLEKFVDSCKGSQRSEEGYFTPQETKGKHNWPSKRTFSETTHSPYLKTVTQRRREESCYARQALSYTKQTRPSHLVSKRTSFHSKYWHSRIHDISEDELIFELQHNLEANGRFRLSDEHTRVSLLSLLALYPPPLDTPARLFEFLNLRTGYTPVLPRSYDSSDSAPSIDAPTPPLRTDTGQRSGLSTYPPQTLPDPIRTYPIQPSSAP